MKIPMPCKLGELAPCNNRVLPLKGVSWFYWTTKGMEYTYFFDKGGNWNATDMYLSTESEQPYYFFIRDSLLKEAPIKEHGFPLKGKGYASGVVFKGGKTYIDFIMTSHYLAHIQVQCDNKGNYMPNGDIIFPPSWEVDKREAIVLKSFKTKEERTQMVQMTLWDW